MEQSRTEPATRGAQTKWHRSEGAVPVKYNSKTEKLHSKMWRIAEVEFHPLDIYKRVKSEQ